MRIAHEDTLEAEHLLGVGRLHQRPIRGIGVNDARGRISHQDAVLGAVEHSFEHARERLVCRTAQKPGGKREH